MTQIGLRSFDRRLCAPISAAFLALPDQGAGFFGSAPTSPPPWRKEARDGTRHAPTLCSIAVMARRPIPKSECRLLSRADARRYCGGLGDERFDREVAPHCVSRLIGLERFYDRLELDAWVDRLGGAVQGAETDWLERVDHDLDQGARR
jgi:hypothetical protein